MLLATPPIESGKTLSYKIIETDGTIIQDWTSTGVTERQIDATANESIYQVDTALITSGFEGHVWWKTNDAIPVTYSETINQFIDSDRASYLDTLARRVEIPASPTFTAAAGTLISGTYYYRITALHPWGESMPSIEVNTVTFQVDTPTNDAFSDGAGILAPATYYYRVSAINAVGETLASTETSHVLTGTGGVNVNWGAVSGATGYKIYGRTTGAELLMDTVGAVTTWLDDGSVSPSSALPVETNAGLESMLDTLITIANQLKTVSDTFQFDNENSVKATQTYPTGEVIYNVNNTKSLFATTLSEPINDYWIETWLRFKTGSNINQIRKVVTYDGGTNFITVSSSFTNIPTDGEEFELINK